MALSFESSLLSTFLKGSSLAALPLHTKEVDIPHSVQNFLLGIIGVYGICSHTFYPYIHEFLLQTYTLIECLERDVLNERYAIYLYIVNLSTKLDRFYFLVSDDGTYIMTVNANMRSLTLHPSKSSFSCSRTFLMMERRFW